MDIKIETGWLSIVSKDESRFVDVPIYATSLEETGTVVSKAYSFLCGQRSHFKQAFFDFRGTVYTCTNSPSDVFKPASEKDMCSYVTLKLRQNERIPPSEFYYSRPELVQCRCVFNESYDEMLISRLIKDGKMIKENELITNRYEPGKRLFCKKKVYSLRGADNPEKIILDVIKKLESGCKNPNKFNPTLVYENYGIWHSCPSNAIVHSPLIRHNRR